MLKTTGRAGHEIKLALKKDTDDSKWHGCLKRQDVRAHENKLLHGYFKKEDAWTHEYKLLHRCSKGRVHEHMNTNYCMDAYKEDVGAHEYKI